MNRTGRSLFAAAGIPGSFLLGVVLLVLGTHCDVHAGGLATPFAGTDGIPLVQIPLDGKVNGLSGAYTAVAEDASGLSVNPAGLENLKLHQLTFTHYDWLGDTSIQNLVYAQPLRTGTIAGSLTFLSVPRMVNYDRYGYEAGTAGIFSVGVAAAYAVRVKGWALGAQLKCAFLDTSGYSAVTFAADLGAQYSVRNLRLPAGRGKFLRLKPLKTGFCLQNIATRAGEDNVPPNIRLGVQYPLLDSLFVALDLTKTVYGLKSLIDADYRLSLGAEYDYKDLVYARVGFRLGYDLNFFSAGLGVRYRFGPVDTYVDYVYQPQKALGGLNNFSLTTKFAELKSAAKVDDNKLRLMETYYYKGLTYYVQEEFDKAIEQWKKALELNPGNQFIQKKIREAEAMKLKLGK